VTIELILKIVFRIYYDFIEANKNQWVFYDLENNNANNDTIKVNCFECQRTIVRIPKKALTDKQHCLGNR
jgi:hypothetical protein